MPRSKLEAPQPGTNRAKVKDLHFLPTRIIIEQTRLSREKVYSALNGMRAAGKLDKLTDQEKRLKLREAQLHASESPWLFAGPFESLGMVPSEIVEAVRLTYGKELSKSSVAASIKQARSFEGRSQSLDSQKRSKLVKDTRYSPIPVKERVALWLDTVAIVLMQSEISWPMNREEWAKLRERYMSERLITSQANKWKELVALFGEDVEESIIKTTREKREDPQYKTTVQLKDMLGDEVEVPDNTDHRQFLLEFGEKLAFFAQGDEATLSDNPYVRVPRHESVGTIVGQLRLHIKAMQRKLGVSDDQMLRFFRELKFKES